MKTGLTWLVESPSDLLLDYDGSRLIPSVREEEQHESAWENEKDFILRRID